MAASLSALAFPLYSSGSHTGDTSGAAGIGAFRASAGTLLSSGEPPGIGGTGGVRASLADTLSNLARENEISTLRSELQECRDDLERDEEIFAEKVRELKSCRKQLRAAQGDNSELQEKLSNCLSQSVRRDAEMRRRHITDRDEREGREGRDGRDICDSEEKEIKREYKNEIPDRNGLYVRTSASIERLEARLIKKEIELEERERMRAEVKNVSLRKGSSHEQKNVHEAAAGEPR